jgi:hypothetical protein
MTLSKSPRCSPEDGSYAPPFQGDYNSVRNFMHLHKPLMEREASRIDHEEDMVTLRAGREHAWLESVIERLLRWFHCSLLEVCLLGAFYSLLAYIRASASSVMRSVTRI